MESQTQFNVWVNYEYLKMKSRFHTELGIYLSSFVAQRLLSQPECRRR